MDNSQLVHLEHALGTFREISEQERKGALWTVAAILRDTPALSDWPAFEVLN